MNTRLLHAEPDLHLAPSSAFRKLARALRLSLRTLGITFYHLGLAQLIIDLSPRRIRTVLYHAVEDRSSSYTTGLGMNISVHTFEKHLDYYQQHYAVASLNDVVAGCPARSTLVLTFDDGYASVASNALPALEARGMPATVFLIGKALQGGMVWVNQVNHALNRFPQPAMAIVGQFAEFEGIARENIIRHAQIHLQPEAIERLVSRLEDGLPLQPATASLFITADEIPALKQRGLSFGYHTRDHYNLQRCNEQTLRRQLDRRKFQHLLDSNTFAYTFGFCGDREADRVQASGFQRAMLVSNDTLHHRPANMLRVEPAGRPAAAVFAQLEVEEPVLTWLKSILRN